MSNEHKAALEVGRAEGRAVRAYLEALRSNKPRRGRKRTAEWIQKRLTAIDELLGEASPVDELLLVQERRDLEAEVGALTGGIDSTALEDASVAVAAAYAERKGIAYASWREVGVPAAVLKRATSVVASS